MTSFPNNHSARVAEGNLCRPYVAGKEKMCIRDSFYCRDIAFSLPSNNLLIYNLSNSILLQCFRCKCVLWETFYKLNFNEMLFISARHTVHFVDFGRVDCRPHYYPLKQNF